jgi:dTDP-4-amino-4,6-dideoxygalactose transaminase
MCSHRESCYSDQKPRYDLRQSELAQEGSILLPIYAQMTDDDQISIANALRKVLHTRAPISATT